MPIAYLKHPVSSETKAEYIGKGFRIIDARFAPEELGAGDVRNDLAAPKPPKRTRKTADVKAGLIEDLKVHGVTPNEKDSVEKMQSDLDKITKVNI